MKKIINHLYIHYPFCTTKCGYCSFYTQSFSWKQQQDYIKVLRREINDYLSNDNYSFKLDTIYFGGGTPSLLPATYISDFTQLFWEVNSDCEKTLECNPITLTPAYINDLKTSRINRLSMGIQSMNENILSYLGRKHLPKQVIELIGKLRDAGYDNISGDLIYGIPHQTLADLEQDIDDFINLDLDHISIYCLSLDENAPLYKDKKLIPKDEIVADMYQLICKKLKIAEFEQYEISNFARDNKYSRHNLAYWDQKDYLGIGPGAFSTIGNIRYYHSNFEEWYDCLDFSQLYPNQEVLTKKDLQNEYIMLQLRLNKGLDPDLLNLNYGYKIWEEKKDILMKFIESGYIKNKRKRLCLTEKSKFISNYVISELMED